MATPTKDASLKSSGPDREGSGGSSRGIVQPLYAQTPIETDGITIGSPSKIAGGIKSVMKALEFTIGGPGVRRGLPVLHRLNQFGGVDCPGCAWPDPDEHRTANEYCENGAKAIAEEATSRRITQDLFERWSVSQLSTQSDYWLGHQGRLTHPMVRRANSDNYAPIAWREAFELIAHELNALAKPDQAIFYTSGRTSNEAAFLYQLFAREFGTNNLPDCSNLCHESSGVALKAAIGVAKGTVTLRDFELADTIFIIGQNPGTNHPRMLTTLEKAARRGATIISVNPLSEVGVTRFKHPQDVFHVLGRGTKIASHFVRVRLSGDLSFFKGICKALFEQESRQPGSVLNQSFIAEKTHDFEPFSSSVGAASWDELSEQSGVAQNQIRKIAQIVARSKAIISCWAMGLTQQKDAVATIQEVVNMHLLGGHLGRPGAGLCPVRGHSNVQGDRTMGIFEKMPDSFLDSLRDTFGFEPPRRHGWDVVESIRAMHHGDAKVFFAMGGNFLSAAPDTEFTAQALSKCDLTVHVATKLNRAHLVTGKQALLLPCLARTDRDKQASGQQFVTVENSMGIIHTSQGNLDPPSEHLLSEPMIVAKLATVTLGSRTKTEWLRLAGDYDLIRDAIAKVVPGCDDMNRRVRKKAGFYLPNPARDGCFETNTAKANFTVSSLEPIRLAPGQFLLTTLRSHDQFNTTIYGLDDRYRGIYNGRRVVFINPADMADYGWKQGDRLDITSHFPGPGGEERRIAPRFLLVPFDIPRRCVAAYFPEANVLVPIGSVAKASNTPTSKSVIVTLAPSHSHDGPSASAALPPLA